MDSTDDSSRTDRERHSRRLFLVTIAAATSTALAGCGGDGPGDGDAEPDGGSDTTVDAPGETTATATGAPTGRTAQTESIDPTGTNSATSDTTESSDGCLSPPVSYVRAQLPGPPTVAFDVPTVAEIRVLSSETEGLFGGRITVPQVAAGGDWTVDVTGNRQEEATVAAALENEPELSEVTGGYDLAVAGARAFEPPERDGLVVFLPTAGRPLRAKVAASPHPDEVRCADAAAAVIERLVETLRPAA